MCIDKVTKVVDIVTNDVREAEKVVWYLTKIQGKVFARLFWRDNIFIEVNKWVFKPVAEGYESYMKDNTGSWVGEAINTSGFHTYKEDTINESFVTNLLKCKVRRVSLEGTQDDHKVYVSDEIFLQVSEEELLAVKDFEFSLTDTRDLILLIGR